MHRALQLLMGIKHPRVVSALAGLGFDQGHAAPVNDSAGPVNACVSQWRAPRAPSRIVHLLTRLHRLGAVVVQTVLFLSSLGLACTQASQVGGTQRMEPATDSAGEPLARLRTMSAVEAAELVNPSKGDLERVGARFPGLQSLAIRGSAADLTALAQLTQLERLTITDASAIDLVGIGRTISLRELVIGRVGSHRDVKLHSLAPLASLRELTSLRVVAPQDGLKELLDTVPLLPRLRRLAHLANGAEEREDAPDLARLAGMSGLETLEIGAHWKPVRLDGIENTRVSTFVLREATASLEPLARHFRHLYHLRLHNYGGAVPPDVEEWRWLMRGLPADLAPLSELTELRSLEIAQVGTSDLGFLPSLTKLERLTLRSAAVRDISALLRATPCHLDVTSLHRLPEPFDEGRESLTRNRAFLRLLRRAVAERTCPRRCVRECSILFDARIHDVTRSADASL